MCALPPELARELSRPHYVADRPRHHPRGHAVVIGASMAGLLAARVLSETYDRVTLLDRDTWPDRPEPRGGVPHGRHAHGLLARGREVLELLFPGLTSDLVSVGAVAGDLQERGRWYFAGVPFAQAPSGLQGLAVSRSALEHEVRRRVQTRHGVSIETGIAVRGLTLDLAAGRVSGVVTTEVATNGPRVRRPADLVVDASGRGSRAPVWLVELGYEAPREEKVRVDVTYATRQFRHTLGSAGDAVAVIVAGSSKDSRGGALIRQEGERWILSLGSYHGDRAPLDLDGFRAAAAARAPEFGEIASTADPVDDGRYFRFPANTRRRYERLKHFPERLVVMGDAVCSFNPVYGQGMTVAAMEALALRDCLGEGVERLGQRFFAAITPAVDVPWQIAVGADLDLPGTPGRPPLPVRLINRYLRRLHLAAADDPDLAGAFLRVANLKAAPPSLLRPGRMVRVLRKSRRRAVADRTPVPVSPLARSAAPDAEPSRR